MKFGNFIQKKNCLYFEYAVRRRIRITIIHHCSFVVIIIISSSSSCKYFSGDQIKKNEMGGACTRMGERKGAIRVLVWKPEG